MSAVDKEIEQVKKFCGVKLYDDTLACTGKFHHRHLDVRVPACAPTLGCFLEALTRAKEVLKEDDERHTDSA